MRGKFANNMSDKMLKFKILERMHKTQQKK